MALTPEEFDLYQWEIEMQRGDTEGIYDPQRLEAVEVMARIIDTAIALQDVSEDLDMPLPPRPDIDEGGGGF